MKAQVKLFALARQLADCDTLEVDLPDGSTVAALRRIIGEQCPPLADLVRHAMFAVDTQYANEDSPIHNDAEIAFIPPVSGG